MQTNNKEIEEITKSRKENKERVRQYQQQLQDETTKQ